MKELSKIYLYRITHILNVPHILKFGITHKDSANSNPDYVPIGDESIITSRNSFVLDNGNRIGDYIPFYFGARSPMLYVIQKGFNNVSRIETLNIVYCVSSVQKIIDSKLDFLFTDGHSVDKLSNQYSIEDIDNIENLLDFEAINSRYWKDEDDLDKKRRKEAEFLVKGDMGLNAILGFIVYTNEAKIKLEEYGVTSEIFVKPDYYF